jgi:hypothetical protein
MIRGFSRVVKLARPAVPPEPLDHFEKDNNLDFAAQGKTETRAQG